MATSRLFLQPTVNQLLKSEALSEAQLLSGADRTDRQVMQVVFGLTSARAGSLVVAKPDLLGSLDAADVKDLAAMIVIRPDATTPITAANAGSGGAAVSVQVELDRLVKIFNEVQTPLIAVPGLGEPAQIAEEIRMAFQAEIKRGSSKLHAHFLGVVLENGLRGLVDELTSMINRPVAVETAEFKLLAGENMGSTPASQQRTLTEEVAEEINRAMRSQTDALTAILPDEPVRIGRRLVMPLVLEGVVVGYISVMFRPSDDTQFITEYMIPAGLAALVDFSHRRKELSTFSVSQRTLLLKDLLAGEMLSPSDQEMLEQHFGFDLCDGFMVFVAQVVSSAKPVVWPERYASVEMETNKVFVLPHDSKLGKTWQQEADDLIAFVRKTDSTVKLQIGAGRMCTSLLDLADAYREARQALIIGQMMHAESEFVLGYGDLGIKRLLYLMIDHPELDRFFEETLAPLEAYDAEWETELLPTLRVYLNQGANLNSAAKELFVHRHTMRYRLEQIAEILNVDIDAPEVLLNLQIAFLIGDLKGKSRG